MKEVEVKILDIDRKQAEKILVSLGAKKVFDDEVTTTIYDFPNKSIKTAKDLIRLRKLGKRSFLTFKKFIEHSQLKVRQEFEVEVSDFNTMHTILLSLGLWPEYQIKKHRTSYHLNDVHFDIDKHVDEYGFIPEFLEIEATDVKTVKKYVTSLGYTRSQCKAWGFSEVINYYKKKQKR